MVRFQVCRLQSSARMTHSWEPRKQGTKGVSCTLKKCDVECEKVERQAGCERLGLCTISEPETYLEKQHLPTWGVPASRINRLLPNCCSCVRWDFAMVDAGRLDHPACKLLRRLITLNSGLITKTKARQKGAELGIEPRTSYSQERPKARILPLNYPADARDDPDELLSRLGYWKEGRHFDI